MLADRVWAVLRKGWKRPSGVCFIERWDVGELDGHNHEQLFDSLDVSVVKGAKPRVSMFFGIIVFFYHDDHPPPHFHAMYEGLDAQFDMKGNVLKGYLPAKAVKLIQEWAALHEIELLENWERARSNLPLNWIAPLR